MMRDFEAGGRSPALGTRAMAATSHPLASLAALDLMRGGGSAVDAALAASAVLCVVEPHMTGIGGDCFALVSPANGPLQALNGSGRAPASLSIEALAAKGVTALDEQSPHVVTIPGAVDAWLRLHERFGTRELEEIFAPAIRLAREGAPVAPRVARDWALEAPRLARLEEAARLFLPNGRAPQAGARFANPALGATLARIASEGRAGFYEGPVRDDLLATLKAHGGLHEAADFEAQCAEWVDPIKTVYRGYEIWECPPNGQGVVALMILDMLTASGVDIAALSEADRIHLLAEATGLAYAERAAHLADPDAMGVAPEALMAPEATAARVARIDMGAASRHRPNDVPSHRDTVYLATVDEAGNAVSFINSLFMGFGSTITAPASGVVLHGRGASFSLEPGHPNALQPGKRPLHTIIPGMVTRGGETLAPFGVMGGHYQAVGHAQLLMNMFDLGADPQAALQTPRSFAHDGVLDLEAGVSAAARAALAARGHEVRTAPAPIGGGQAIWIDRARGLLIGGSDPRKDGLAIGW